jgi:hypothetical protein
MKTVVLLVSLLVILSVPCYSQTIEELEAQIDSIKSVQDSAGIARAYADVDSVVTNRAKLAAAGITIMPHPADSVWVVIDFPVSSATGYKKAALKMTYLWLLQGYMGKPDETAWRLRVRTDRAKRALRSLNAYF